MDWDFRGESTRTYYPHNLCWYPSRFVPQIPGQFIAALSKKGDTVYDPFCGCGTTLVESLKMGRNAVATDLSPVATFLTSVKGRIVTGETVNVECLREIHDALVSKGKSLFDSLSEPISSPTPSQYFSKNMDELLKWHHPVTLNELISIKSAINSLGSGLTFEIANAAFMAILMPSSGLPGGRPYTYYADNVKPKLHMLQKDAFGLFRSRLARVITGQSAIRLPSEAVSWSCKAANILQLNSNDLGSVDLVVTSPPYLGVTDYVTGFRLAHLWYDFDCDISTLKQSELGARWKRKRPGGLADYLEGMNKSMRLMANCLRPGGYICLVLGEAKKHSEAVLQALTDNAVGVLGLTSLSSFRRNVNQNFFLHPSGGVATEEILVFQK